MYASIETLLFWQTPDFFDLAQSSKHLSVLFIDCRSFRHSEQLDHVSMRAGHDDKRIHAARFPAADVFLGNIRGVVHDGLMRGRPGTLECPRSTAPDARGVHRSHTSLDDSLSPK
jgi:hypothetical protein